MISSEKYEVIKVLGQGGMGKVYLAKDTEQDRLVAIKQSHKSQAQRLQREYKFLTQIDHPNIIKAYDFFAHQDIPYLVLEYIAGISLQEYIENHPRPPLTTTVSIALQITDGLSCLNSAGVLHRDLKPDNIMVDLTSGVAKLLDLGVGRSLQNEGTQLTQQGHIIGTLEYMSPEQLQGEVAANSDIFALGIIWFQLFRWQAVPPFRGKNMMQTIHSITKTELPKLTETSVASKPENLKFYSQLSDIHCKMLEKNSHKRIADFTTLITEIKDLCRRHPEIFEEQSQWQIPKLFGSVSHTRKKSKKRGARKAPEGNFTGLYISAVISVFLFLAVAAWLYGISSSPHASKNPKNKELSRNQNPEVTPPNNKDSEILYLQAMDQYKRQDYASAFRNLELAARQNNAKAMTQLGLMYYKGEVVKQSNTQAIEWYLKAIKRGDSLAKVYLGEMYLNRIESVKNYAKAKELFIEAIESPLAKTRLASMYFYGYGVEKNIARAIELYRQAIEQGNIEAIGDLAYIYKETSGYTNDAEAFRLYSQLSEKNDPSICFHLGELYYLGRGTKVDHKKAFFYTQKAVEGSHVKALGNLGLFYYRGHGVEQDYKKALQFTTLSAEKGNTVAMFNLGTFYAVPPLRDLQKMNYWFNEVKLRDANAHSQIQQFLQNVEK